VVGLCTSTNPAITQVVALVDTGASHFLKKELARKLGLRVGPCQASVNIVNSNAKSTLGVSSKVIVQLDKWKGATNFSVVQLDDFEVIRGQDFLRKPKAALFLFANSMEMPNG
jgi:hypothetical protein